MYFGRIVGHWEMYIYKEGLSEISLWAIIGRQKNIECDAYISVCDNFLGSDLLRSNYGQFTLKSKLLLRDAQVPMHMKIREVRK